MSPQEYMKQSDDFMIELNKRLHEKEGLTAKIIQVRGATKYIQILNEVYSLFNDGNNCRWDFVGIVK